MAAPEPPLPPCRALSDPAPSSSNATTPVASSSKAPVTGFRSSLEHTGIPRSVLLWKPRLPSRNWTIFLTVAGTVSYLYYDDRRQCRRIKAATIERVKHLSQEPMPGSLDLPRKIIAIGARWPEDDDDGRALRYFRKYVKPYLDAASIDYDQIPAPLHGSVKRQIQASILKKRRQALGLEPLPMSLPHSLDPKAAEARELEGGVVLVGRASLKEYIEGLRQGWTGGVGEWDWEKDVERKLEADGVFDTPKPEFQPDEIDPTPESIPTPPPISPNTPVSALPSGLSFLSRPPPPQMTPSISNPASPSPPLISSHFHTPPSPLPPQPPILLLPFTNHLGFNQFPYMIYDFFTERYRVQSGADAGLALIEGHTRPFSEGDREWDRDGEKWYTKSFSQLLDRINTARKDYYSALEPRIESARTLASGARELSVAEKKSSKPPLTETDLRAERQKRELRWFGNEDGYEIVRKETEVAWDESFDGWLRVFELSESG